MVYVRHEPVWHRRLELRQFWARAGGWRTDRPSVTTDFGELRRPCGFWLGPDGPKKSRAVARQVGGAARTGPGKIPIR